MKIKPMDVLDEIHHRVLSGKEVGYDLVGSKTSDYGRKHGILVSRSDGKLAAFMAHELDKEVEFPDGSDISVIARMVLDEGGALWWYEPEHQMEGYERLVGIRLIGVANDMFEQKKEEERQKSIQEGPPKWWRDQVGFRFLLDGELRIITESAGGSEVWRHARVYSPCCGAWEEINQGEEFSEAVYSEDDFDWSRVQPADERYWRPVTETEPKDCTGRPFLLRSDDYGTRLRHAVTDRGVEMSTNGEWMPIPE